MKAKKIFTNSRRGAVLPLVALVMVFVLFGFAAIVVDAGMLYGERRNMVTAADAGALAGAQVMSEALGTPGYNTAKTEAEEDAVRLAILNGIEEEDDIEVIIGYDSEFDRDTIRVRVKNNNDLVFARILGFNDTDVAAEAVASWGYITKLEGGDIIPVFTKDSDYQESSITYLHSGKFVGNDGDIINGNWGLLDIFPNTSMIGEALAGELVGESLELDWILDNQTGLNVGNVNNPIEDRMQVADTLENREDREKFMRGLVPVIEWNEITKHGSQLKLPIKHFAVFEIYDVIIKEGNNNNKPSEGSKYALYDEPDYTSDGDAKEYEPVGGLDLEKSSILGKFTGDIVEVRAILDPDDQTNPSPGTDTAKYFKLIK